MIAICDGVPISSICPSAEERATASAAIAPAAAVGGVLKPGDRVDVMTIPNVSRQISPVDQAAPVPAMIGKNILVIGLRTDQGTDVSQTDHGLNIGSKPASVLLAIPQTEETTYSAAIVAGSFVLALSTD